MSKKLTVGGNQKTVAAYYEGQKTSGSPDHYETVVEANRLRRTGKASSINRGKAILIRGPRRMKDSTRDSVKRSWKVTGQTPKKNPLRPGFPHWGSV